MTAALMRSSLVPLISRRSSPFLHIKRRLRATVLERQRGRAQARKKVIALSEGTDDRVRQAARWATDDGIAKVILVGNKADILGNTSVDLDGVDIIDPSNSELTESLADGIYQQRKKKGLTIDGALKLMQDADYFTQMLVRNNVAHGSVMGAVCSSSKTAKSAVWCIGLSTGNKTASSFFIMDFPESSPIGKRQFVYADCGFVIDPTAEQLADIAIAAAESARGVLGMEPNIAMLSFSTKGSGGNHPNVLKVQKALELVKERAPELVIDGELQLDAALIPAIGNKKAPGSPVVGKCNIFIFPDLQAGNIGYKLSERMGGATAIGPILQGLKYPANDVSRGCSSQDLYDAILVTNLQERES